jgi:hypothetical protein
MCHGTYPVGKAMSVPRHISGWESYECAMAHVRLGKLLVPWHMSGWESYECAMAHIRLGKL